MHAAVASPPTLLPAQAEWVRQLEATFAQIARTRMAGLPVVHPRLRVQAVGFHARSVRVGGAADEPRAIEAGALGVLVTPWFMNLVVAPRETAQWRSLPPGEKRRYRFPAGDYDFVSAVEDGVGEFFLCSLFSPVCEFDDPPTARFVAQQALAALLDPANDARAPAAGPGPVAQVQKKLGEPMSRRDVLRGRFLPSTDDAGR